MLSKEKKELIAEAKKNVQTIITVNQECKNLSEPYYTACYFGETTGFVVSNVRSGFSPTMEHIAFGGRGALKTEKDVLEVIRLEESEGQGFFF